MSTVPTAANAFIPLSLHRGGSGLSRRGLIGGAMAAACMASGGRAEAPPGLADLATGIRPALIDRALHALAEHEARIWSRDMIAIVDFARPSAVPRLHLVDLLNGRTTSLLVAHGKGSDPDHSGTLQRFSNVEGSLASSEGAYLTGETYSGVHGVSRRLIGLDPTNEAAERRAIVIHAAWYVGPDVVARQAMLGRSDGCFVVSPTDLAAVIIRLGRGRLLYAG